VHCHATLCHYLSRSVSRTCGPLTHVRAGPPASKRQGELEGSRTTKSSKPGPESMSRCIEFACDAIGNGATKQHAGEHLTFSEHPQAELRSCDVRNAARDSIAPEITGICGVPRPHQGGARCCKKAEPVRQVTDSSSFDEVRQRVSLRLLFVV
jgi:hypothetical protein